MTTVVDDRNGCALHGAVRLLGAIGKVVPVVHANSGCALAAGFGDSAGGGHAAQVPGATRVQERHVVFGGTSRLREQIRNTIKVLKGDAYVVLSGCVPEVVGDDAPAMVKEAREQNFPVLNISTPGFKGNAYSGFELALAELAGQLPEILGPVSDAEAGSINLLGIAPGQDAFWEGDLLELERQIGVLGVPVRRLLGVAQTSDDWRSLPKARLNVVLSPWGLAAAERLQKSYGTPFVDFGWLPVGSRDLGALIGQIAAHLGFDEARVVGLRKDLDDRLRYFLQKLAPAYLEHDLQKRVAIVAGSAYAVGLARYLAGTLGQTLASVVITDVPEARHRQRLIDAIRDVGEGREIPVLFSARGDEIAQQLLAAKPELIFGSAFEQRAARSLGIALVESAFPLSSGPVLSRSYAGLSGALALAEDLSSAVIADQERAVERATKAVVLERSDDAVETVLPAYAAKVITAPSR